MKIRKTNIIYIIIGVFTLALILYLEYNKKEELNWFPSYVAQHKIPYGTKVFNDILEQKFTTTTPVTVPPFKFLESNDTKEQSTYLFINNSVSFQKTELEALLDWTAKGNTLFIASSNFEKELLDTLHLETKSLFGDEGLAHEFQHRLVNPQLNSKIKYQFKKSYSTMYFSQLDTLNTVVIGEVSNGSGNNSDFETHPNSIQQQFGAGKIILTTFPIAFTNYFILKDNNRNYTAGMLSYIDEEKPIYIDAYYKSGKKFYTSPMYIFLNTKELKWAYYMIIIGALVYVLFEGKRKQRAVPIVKPLQNQTLAFTRTIAEMYYEKGDRKAIAQHKISYFLEYIRSHFYLNTSEVNEDFFENLAARTHHDPHEIKDLFLIFSSIKHKEFITDAALIQLNTAIENFKSKAHGK
ncbi:DUF4350 domain-containing protein [Cellulophaga sp. HaHa_2_1]|uniref:DUF4350 domain-containing protein n=1 Tax=Cellulophaga sp. HaHa_2_1 TaxID=2749994 RepID=UPI001C4FBB92|nr:DUF4350 domain-containing protein [Cellulophaga sp. HaHa_2_1]QXP52240.1 DUF4350 domain-containing protein [Cellulophaga sp. HaHa_2_1]